MHVPSGTIVNALKAAEIRSGGNTRGGYEIVTAMNNIGISPTKFAQGIADYVMTEYPAHTTSAPEQEPPTTPAIGDIIAIRDAQPGMTVEISTGQKRFHGKVETVLTVGHQTEINGIEFNATSAATITPQWTPPMRHIIM